MLALQAGQLVDVGVVEQGANLVEREPGGPVHQHHDGAVRRPRRCSPR